MKERLVALKNTCKMMMSLMNILFFLLGCAGFLLVMVYTSKYGPGVSHDSVAYIYAARSFADGSGLRYFGYPSPFIQWPPLFPVLLAFAQWLGVGAVEASRVVNAAAFGGIVFLTGKWLSQKTKSAALAIIGTVAILLSPQLLTVSVFVWTEGLFVLFLMLFLFAFERYLAGKGFKWLVWAAIFTSLACLDRYMGITIILTGVIFLFFRKKKFSARVVDILTFGTIAALPTALWVIRNYIVSSTFVGMRTPALVTFGHNVKLTIKTFLSWILPYGNLYNFPFPETYPFIKAAVYAVMVLFAAGLLWVAVSRIRVRTTHLKEAPVEAAGKVVPFLLAVFILIYTVYMVISASKVAFDPIGNRYLIPVYVPLFLLAFMFIDWALWAIPEKMGRKWISNVLLTGAVLWLLYPLAGTTALLNSAFNIGTGGLASKNWLNNKLVSYLKEAPLKGEFYTNDAAAVYYLAGINASYTPKRQGLEMYGYERFDAAVKAAERSYLAWFGPEESATIYTPRELRQFYELEKVMEFPEGTLYLIKQRG